jgi:hypothetical protein
MSDVSRITKRFKLLEPSLDEREVRKSKSLRKLADELTAMGLRIGKSAVAGILRKMGYSLQANRKTREGSSTGIETPNFSTSVPRLQNF